MTVMNEDRFTQQGLTPTAWSAGPGAWFGEHTHPRAKLLVCRGGSITFTLHPSGESHPLAAGDWIDLPAGQRHTAIAGPAGCRCEEAFR
jgi:quercetin dioxygenase-like cupin family protein